MFQRASFKACSLCALGARLGSNMGSKCAPERRHTHFASCAGLLSKLAHRIVTHTGTLPTSLLFDGKLRSGLQKRTRMNNPWYEQPLAWANLMAPLAGKTPKHHPWAPQASRGSEKSHPATASSGQPSHPRAPKGPPSRQSRPGLGPFGRPWTSTGSLWGTRGTQKRRPPAHPQTTEI